MEFSSRIIIFVKKVTGNTFFAIVKKLIIIMTALLLIAIALPILAANAVAANTSGRCNKENGIEKFSNPDPAQSDKPCCKKNDKAEESEENDREEEEEEILGAKSIDPDKEKENSNNTSFNFLYYLFYKSSINEYLKGSECDVPGRNR